MKIVFLCVANSARSQMAEGVARKIFGDSAMVESAGSSPSFVHPLAIEVLGEIGVDTSSHRSKSVDDIDFSNADLIVTLCAEEVCPIVPGNVEKLHWGLPDPAAVKGDESTMLNAFRQIRDELIGRLEGLKQKLRN
jgi:arsenate reductase (thioredoxin)